jgi:Ca2+-binding EF-hand superfamily protein
MRNVQDGSGAIDQDELMAALKKLGVMVSEDEVVVMMRQADIDGNGEIDVDEFVSIFIDN